MAIGLNLIKFKKKIRQIDELLCEFDQNHGKIRQIADFILEFDRFIEILLLLLST